MILGRLSDDTVDYEQFAEICADQGKGPLREVDAVKIGLNACSGNYVPQGGIKA